jgi:hypothetical protein
MKSTITKSVLLTAWLSCCLWASLAFSAGTAQPSTTRSSGTFRGGTGSSRGSTVGAMQPSASNMSGGYGSSFAASSGMGLGPMRMTFQSMADELKKAAYAEKPALAFTKRELKYDVSEEEFPIELYAVDTKLLEQRYVAIIRIVVPSDYTSQAVPESLQFLYRICFMQQSEPSARVLKVLGDNTPSERLPAKDILAALTTEGASHVHLKIVGFIERPSGQIAQDISTGFSPSQRRATRSDATLEYRIYAPTAQRAKELVEGMLSLQDNGLFSTIQQELQAAKRKWEANLQESREHLEKTQKESKTVQDQLDAAKEYADISEQTLSGLETQQRLVEVDMEGLKARVKACNDLLETSKRSPATSSRIEQLENLKIAAEVELAGLTARKASIQQIVAGAHKRNNLQVALKQASAEINVTLISISRLQNMIADVEMDLKDFTQVRVEDNQVRIRRVKWESPNKVSSMTE